MGTYSYTFQSQSPYESPWGITYGSTFNLSSGYVHAVYDSNPNNPGFFQLFVATNPFFSGVAAASGRYIEDPLSQNITLSSGTVTRIDADGTQFWDKTTQTGFIVPEYLPVQSVPASGLNIPLRPFKYQVQNEEGPSASAF